MTSRYSNPKSFVNFLLPNREFGEGWGGVKNLRLLQGLLYLNFAQKNSELKFECNTKGVLIIRFPVAGDSVNPEADLIIDLGLWNRQTRLGFTFSASTVFNIMFDRLTIISRSGRVFEMGDCWQVWLVREAPTKIPVARPDMI
jgi:hypothetical protein